MNDTIIKVEGLGKKYIISHEGKESYTALRDVISRKAKGLVKKKADLPEKEDFWALKDVNFEIKKGDALGIIGRNGAGKSTLLKVLSRITEPTHGRVEMNGRVASLLEVGTGFHPELTGRENIFLNGAILGMSRVEIRRKFDEIVDFSGVEKFLDTPVKRYSSGMYVRLAFAVAAHLEPEILIVDEVLAVGDTEFQKKCLGRMKDVSMNEGRTVLFVSHNMIAMQNLCTRALFLENGTVSADGQVSEVINKYNALFQTKSTVQIFDNKDIWVSGFNVFSQDPHNEMAFTFRSNVFNVGIDSKIAVEDVYIGIGVNDAFGARLFTLYSSHFKKKYKINPGKNEISCLVERLPLKPGIYSVEIYVGDGRITYDYYSHGLKFEVFPSDSMNQVIIPDESQGNFMVEQNWR